MTATEIKLRVVNEITDVPRAAWDACANPQAPSESLEPDSQTTAAEPPPRSYNPFISHDFLASLEISKSVHRRTGWDPLHLVVEDKSGDVLATVPCYVKSHSRGEYVFDHGWADAYERAGGSYYPKLQVAVPFTPATGRRLLVKPGPQAAAVRNAVADSLAEVSRQSDASGVHVTFLPKDEWEALGERGYLKRTHQQFHFENPGYPSFDGFLAELASRKRKTIRRERAEALANGVSIHWLTGKDLTEEVWDAFFHFYMETGSRKWGRPYLTREFYSVVGEKMADRILLVMAKRNGRWIAGAINFIGSDTLFGRHWGAVEHHPFLHFEVCYYQAIDYAIAHKLTRVEAGAQGEHKLARGYMPTTTYSAHYIADPGLRRAIADFVARERDHVEAANEELAEYAPFRKADVP